MSFDINSIPQAIATIGIIAGTAYATLPLVMWNKRLNLTTLHTVATVAQQVVAGIEQTQAASSGPDKKFMALTAITGILSALNVQVPDPYVNMAVEAAVLALSKPKDPPPAPSSPVPPPSAQSP